MSREEVSIQSGIREEVIDGLETDFDLIKDTSAFLLFRLAHVFGCTMEDLMEI